MSLLLNLLWLFLGPGILSALFWLIAAVLMALTIIGIPWARACLMLAGYSLLPFGHRLVSVEEATGRGSIGTGPLGLLANIVWFVLAGWWLALWHLVVAAGQAITIIGIPFAWANLKLAGASLAPVGKSVVEADFPGLRPR
jgi:uncharacterized membrane protein YccF (DUF307 family)